MNIIKYYSKFSGIADKSLYGQWLRELAFKSWEKNG